MPLKCFSFLLSAFLHITDHFNCHYLDTPPLSCVPFIFKHCCSRCVHAKVNANGVSLSVCVFRTNRRLTAFRAWTRESDRQDTKSETLRSNVPFALPRPRPGRLFLELYNNPSIDSSTIEFALFILVKDPLFCPSSSEMSPFRSCLAQRSCCSHLCLIWAIMYHPDKDCGLGCQP